MRNILSLCTIAVVAAFAFTSCCSNTSEGVNTGVNNPTIQTIMSRKSVRAFSDQKITDEQMTAMLKAALAAPSGSDVRPWSVVVLTDTSTYDAIFTKKNFNLVTFKSSQAVVVFCADTTVMRIPRGAPEGTQPSLQVNSTWRDDLGAMTENFLLAAESLGLGAVWTASYPYHDRMDPIKEALGLPATVVPYCAVPVGYPAADNQPKDKWDESRIHYNKW